MGILRTVAFAAVLAFSGAAAAAEPRAALVIGNGDYRSGVPKLANAVNDARAIDQALRDDGFHTTLKINAGRREFYAAIHAFAREIAGGAVGLFYYAGHGIQANGHNYLIPIDAELDTEGDLGADAIDVALVLDAMDEARNPMNIVILDACRDNPLPRTRSAARGLARVEAPRGTFIAYAAAPGQAAQDGPAGGHGVFTGELVKALAEPGLKIEDVFKKVTTGVLSKTESKQVPWIEASIQIDFYFRPPAPTPPPPANATASLELAFWETIRNSNDPDDFNDYLRRYPEGAFGSVARRRLEALLRPPPLPAPKPPAPTKAAQPPLRPPTSVGSSAPPPPNPRLEPRCAAILQRSQLGETLSDDDRAYLKETCR